MKRILVIQDLSCVGRCSLTVAQPILSAMGIQCSVLPTAVFSTHTGFPNPHIHNLTDEISPILSHWQAVGVTFDGILVGYLSDPQQVEQVLQVMSAFECPVILDPAMADNGKLYQGITQDHVEAMADLAAMAQVVLPNVTEASLLTGLPYLEQTDGHYLRMMLERLCRMKTKTVLITGITPSAQQTGFAGIQAEEGLFSYSAVRQPKSLHGTGDMFSAVFAGAYLLGSDPMEAGALAARFVERVLETVSEATPYGAEFEKQLPWLWQQL